MLHAQPLHVLKRHRKVIFLAGLLVGLLSFLLSMLFPLQYRADGQMLVVSKTRYGVDPYTAVKSAERVGENLARVVDTDLFYNQMLAHGGTSLDTSMFANLSDRKRREKWEKTVDANVVFGTSVLNVSAYHTDPAQARAYATAAMETLVSKGWEFVGGDVTIKVVNRPVSTRFPARPNFLVNGFAGFILGAVLMAALSLRKRKHFFS